MIPSKRQGRCFCVTTAVDTPNIRRDHEVASTTRLKTPWSKAKANSQTWHAWTDGSYREAAGLGWLITEDQKGGGPVIAQGARNLGGQQTAFDAELSAIEQAVRWFLAQRRGPPIDTWSFTQTRQVPLRGPPTPGRDQARPQPGTSGT
jgi:hypothetical protein